MPLDIRPDHMEIVRNILENVIPEREVWAFGKKSFCLDVHSPGSLFIIRVGSDVPGS